MPSNQYHDSFQEQDFLPPATMGLGARIVNELEEGENFSEDDDDEEEKKRAGRGAEVAPPCDMTYYGATQVLIDLVFMIIILLP